MRPRFHFTPERNFMNDPNGLVFYDGEYHLFYQHNPFGDTWGHMSWGHAVSRDLLRWQHLPVALPEEQEVMVFSGSAVVDWRNTAGFAADAQAPCLVAIFTGHGRGRQTQNLAYSHDRGRTWTRYAGNPVLDLGTDSFRDPKVFWHEPARRWIMLAAMASRRVIALFASPDLKQWEPLSEFGPQGATGGEWECPDLFPLPVEGAPGETRWVLAVDLNPGGKTGGSGGQYFVGTFDGTHFVNDNDPATTLWVDHGKDFYASLSFSDIPPADGRRVWIGWMGNWAYANVEPTAPWRGVQSVPRELGLRRTPEGIRLLQRPIAELTGLRVTVEPQEVAPRASLPPAAEIELELVRGEWQEAGLRLGNAAGEEVDIGLQGDSLEVFVDRRRSRAVPFHDEYPARHTGPVRWRDGRATLRILLDHTTLEVFANDGETVISDRVHSTRPLDRVETLHAGHGLASAPRFWELRAE